MSEPEQAHVSIRVERLGEERRGLWCEDCMLPSIVAADLVLLLNDQPDHVFTASICTDCGQLG